MTLSILLECLHIELYIVENNLNCTIITKLNWNYMHTDWYPSLKSCSMILDSIEIADMHAIPAWINGSWCWVTTITTDEDNAADRVPPSRICTPAWPQNEFELMISNSPVKSSWIEFPAGAKITHSHSMLGGVAEGRFGDSMTLSLLSLVSMILPPHPKPISWNLSWKP